MTDAIDQINKLNSIQYNDNMKVSKDISDMKGPFITEVNNIKRENESLMRELEKTQSINRDIVYE